MTLFFSQFGGYFLNPAKTDDLDSQSCKRAKVKTPGGWNALGVGVRLE
jgi:hypothetical protein